MLLRKLNSNGVTCGDSLLQRKYLVLSIGSMSFVIATTLSHFLKGTGIADFFAGMFTGLSLVFNIVYLIIICKK